MKKVLAITWKDIVLLVRDRAALIMILAAPFALTLGLGAISGGFSSQSSGVGDIPLTIVNMDRGELGGNLLQALESPNLNGLFTIQVGTDIAAARLQVESDQIAGLVIIPADFSASFQPNIQSDQTGPVAPVELYTSPERPYSASIIRSVLTEMINSLQLGPLSSQVVVQGLINSGRLAPDPTAVSQVTAALRSMDLSQIGGRAIRIQVGQESPTERNQPPNALSYLAPAMAVLFLMYTVTLGGRSLLTERENGTLARILTTSTTSAQILGGKVSGIFITGFLQVSILILVSALLFGLRWGAPLAVVLLVCSVCLAATGWGILLASLASTPWQVGGIGSALMIIFGLLGGTFVPTSQFSDLVRMLAKITPNYWSNTGFSILIGGGGLKEITGAIEALWIMAAILFTVSIFFARKRWASGFARK